MRQFGDPASFLKSLRPQANGLVEVAGRTVINVLRQIQADHYIDCVESLPGVLRLRHDLRNKETRF